MNITEQGIEDFNWDDYESQDKKIFNKKVLEKYPDSKVYTNNDYALELYELMLDYPIKIKDVTEGDIIQIVSIKSLPQQNKVVVTAYNGLSLTIDLGKERRFCNFFDTTPENLWDMLHEDEHQEVIINANVYIELRNTSQGIIGSLSRGVDHKIENEFVEQIKNPTSAYQAKVVEKNKGGFFVKVQGINAFLPGGLAAANKITDFNALLGKEIPVMIEDYIKDNNTFIVSNKKYLNYILPERIKSLDLTKEYIGRVTDTAKFGIFIEFGEFGEIFTGLIHVSKMLDETKTKFKNRNIKPGDEMHFWIKEIGENNKIILVEENPVIKKIAFTEFKESSIGMTKPGRVISNKPFGTLVKMEKDIIGLISKKELKAKNLFLEVGDPIMVTIDDIKKNKIYLSLPDEA